ncbi:MAG: hypothetical protein KDA25_02695, partial [Phycisphaerales bacterium]|nr:hypothetical protein [Phycisphaerales bacterium]
MTSRDARRRRIVELVGRNRIDSQEQLLDLLAAESITTTQATLSRDLRSLGVVKGADGYEVLFDGTDERAVWKTLGRSLAGLVEHVAVGGTMVVL